MNKTNIQKLILIIADLASMWVAFVAAIVVTQLYHHDLRYFHAWHNFFHFGISKILGLTVIGLFWYQEQYSKRQPFWENLLKIYRTIFFLLLLNFGISFAFAKGSLKILIVAFWLLFALLLPILRIVAKAFMSRMNLWQRDLFIIGTNSLAFYAQNLFANNKLMGYKLGGFVQLTQDYSKSVEIDDKLLVSKKVFIEYLHKNRECDIIVAICQNELNQQVSFINYLQHNCLSVLVLPEIAGLALYGAEIEHFFASDQLVLRLNNNLARNFNALIKRGFDLLCVISGITLLSPLFIVISLIIKFTTKGRVFFLHKRVGRHGKEFYCIKFQTMYMNSNELLNNLIATDNEARREWEENFKLKNDPRVTPIGEFLRKTSLDELPQLFNVLLGQMSLVGPRPIVSKEIERYKEGYYYYQLVTPGITGLWQVSGRSDLDYTDRVRLDEWYVKNWSLWYDIVILIKTFGVVFRRSGAY